jgi:hypothetical protein
MVTATNVVLIEVNLKNNISSFSRLEADLARAGIIPLKVFSINGGLRSAVYSHEDAVRFYEIVNSLGIDLVIL